MLIEIWKNNKKSIKLKYMENSTVRMFYVLPDKKELYLKSLRNKKLAVAELKKCGYVFDSVSKEDNSDLEVKEMYMTFIKPGTEEKAFLAMEGTIYKIYIDDDKKIMISYDDGFDLLESKGFLSTEIKYN